MLCFFDKLVKLLFAFLHLGAGHSVQHYSAHNSCSLPRSLFTPSCFHLPSLYSFSSHFPFYTDHRTIFFLVFLPFISLARSFFHHNFILQIPIELCRSQSRNTSRQLEGLFYCIPSLFLCFCESFLLCAISAAAAAAPVGVKTGHGDLALVVVVVGHWLPVCTDTFTSTQTPHKHYTTQKQTHRSASSICLDGGSGFLVVVVLVKEKRKGEKGNTANRTTKSTTTTTGTWCTAFCLRYSFCLLSFFFFFSFSIYLPTATTAAKAEAPLSGAHSFYVFPFFSLSFTK